MNASTDFQMNRPGYPPHLDFKFTFHRNYLQIPNTLNNHSIKLRPTVERPPKIAPNSILSFSQP